MNETWNVITFGHISVIDLIIKYVLKFNSLVSHNQNQQHLVDLFSQMCTLQNGKGLSTKRSINHSFLWILKIGLSHPARYEYDHVQIQIFTRHWFTNIHKSSSILISITKSTKSKTVFHSMTQHPYLHSKSDQTRWLKNASSKSDLQINCTLPCGQLVIYTFPLPFPPFAWQGSTRNQNIKILVYHFY